MALFDEEQFNEEVHFARLFSDVAHSFGVTAEQITGAANTVKRQQRQRPWQKCLNYGGIDYNDRVKCCGYLKRYAACHCALARYSTQETFLNIPTYVRSLLSRNHLRVVSVGGGPGNDLIGFCSAMFSRCWYRLQTVDLTVIDLKAGWEEIFREVISSISRDSYGYVTEMFNKIDVHSEFVTADLTVSPTPSGIQSADIVLMTKVLSVVSNPQKDKILQGIFSSMKEGAIFLFTDRESGLVLRNSHCGMKVLYRSSPGKSFIYAGSDRNSIARAGYEICAVQKSEQVEGISRDIWNLRTRPCPGFHPIGIGYDKFGFENDDDYDNCHGDGDFDHCHDESEDDSDYANGDDNSDYGDSGYNDCDD